MAVNTQRKPTTTTTTQQTASPTLAPNTGNENVVDLSQYKMDELLKEHHSKSNVIRFLSAQELSRADIARVTGLRYQHVRNVLITPVTKPRD